MTGTRHPVRSWLVAAALAAATFGWFSSAASLGFLDYDDPDFVTRNAHVLGGLSWRGLRWAFTSGGNAANWQPLTWVSLMIDAQLFGANPAAFHLTNVLWHAVNAALAFFVLRELTGRYGASAWGAALFAWHPLRAESVAWIAERKDVLSVCFGLLTIWAYSRDLRARCGDGAETPGQVHPGHATRKVSPWYFGSLTAFLLGLLCKPMLVSLPLVLWSIEWARASTGGAHGNSGHATVRPRNGAAGDEGGELGRPKAPPGGIPCLATQDGKTRSAFRIGRFRRGPPRSNRCRGAVRPASGRSTALRLLPFLLAAAGSGAVTVAVQYAGGAMSTSDPLSHRLANAVASIARYLGKFAWPARLAACYPQQRPMPAENVALGAAALGALIWVALRVRRTHPLSTVGITWFLVTLAPVLGIIAVGPQAMADRYTYLPSLGLELALISCVPECIAAGRMPRIALSGAAVATLSAAGLCARRQIPFWRDSSALFEHALAVTSNNDIAHAAFATTLLNAGDLRGAARHCAAALRINPRSAPALVDRGILAERAGRVDAARQDYGSAIAVASRYAAPHLRLAALLLHHGKPADSIPEFEIVQRLRPESAEGYFGEALARVALCQDSKAERGFRRALELRPEYPEAHNAYANLLANRREFGAAEAHYKAALRVRPTFAEAHFNLANTLADEGQMVRALPHYTAAARLDPNDRDFRNALAEALRTVAAPAASQVP